MSTLDTSKQYAFISYSVNDILEGLDAYTEEDDYLFLKRLSHEKLDCLLERAFMKGWVFWESDSAIDFAELESLAKMLYEGEA